MSLTKIKKQSGTKDDLDPTKDEFITKTTSVFDWAYEHRRPLGLLMVLALIGAVAGIIIDRVMESKRAEESALVSAGLAATFGRIKSDDADDAASKKDEDAEDDVLTFDSAQARAKEALNRWTHLVEEGDPRYKSIGELEEASSLLDLGENEKALAAFRAFMAGAGNAPSWLKAQASEGLGYALEALGKLDEAKASFQKWMDQSEGPTKVIATYHTARLAQKEGDAETAKKLFKEVLDAYKDANAPGRYDVIFVQARTRLLTLDPSADVPPMPAGDMGAFDGIDPRILQQMMQSKSGSGAS